MEQEYCFWKVSKVILTVDLVALPIDSSNTTKLIAKRIVDRFHRKAFDSVAPIEAF